YTFLGKSSAARHREHALAGLDVRDVRRRLEHYAGGFISRSVGRLRLDLVLACDLQRVGKTETYRVHADANAARRELRSGNVLHRDLRRRTIAAKNDCAHDCSPSSL